MKPVLSPKQWLACGLMLLAATACHTRKPAVSRLPELPPMPPLVSTPQPVSPVVPSEPTVTAIPAATVTPTAIPIPTAPAVVSPSEWVAWESWRQANGSGAGPPGPPTPPNGVYSAATTGGTFAIRIGSRLASWNGIACWLGFAPKLVGNKPYIHTLDLQKTFLPLSQAASPTIKRNQVVVIDPGHGGENAGTRSPLHHRLEKDLTLDWALRLKPLLVEKGWTVFLTRTNDFDVPLADRVQCAERHNADLFLSLHFNSASPNRDAAGIETYCLTPAGMPSNLVRENEDDATQAHPNNGFDEDNLRLAARIHRALLAATGAADRGVRRARFMGVLKGQHRPAVLIEGGFLSNPKEAGLINTPEYRQRLAGAVADALP